MTVSGETVTYNTEDKNKKEQKKKAAWKRFNNFWQKEYKSTWPNIFWTNCLSFSALFLSPFYST